MRKSSAACLPQRSSSSSCIFSRVERVERAERLVDAAGSRGPSPARGRCRRAGACRRTAPRPWRSRESARPISSRMRSAAARRWAGGTCAQARPELNVAAHVQPGKQRIVLEHHAPLGARADDRLARRASPGPHRAIKEAGEELQQRGLAAAGGADSGDELAVVDRQRHPIERPDGSARAPAKVTLTSLHGKKSACVSLWRRTCPEARRTPRGGRRLARSGGRGHPRVRAARSATGPSSTACFSRARWAKFVAHVRRVIGQAPPRPCLAP